MVTKEQATAAGQPWGFKHDAFHYGECSRTVGPRGGVKVSIVSVRRSGKTQVWKTRPEEFRIPVKYGMYESSEITQRNAGDFHIPEDCPLAEPEPAHVPNEEAPGSGCVSWCPACPGKGAEPAE